VLRTSSRSRLGTGVSSITLVVPFRRLDVKF